jgi:type IV secretion/conjugal transfer VirB4 family ATPase
MMNFTEYREPSGRMPDYLPWAFNISDTTVMQKDGLLLRCWRYRGPDLSTASRAEQGTLAERINAALGRLGSGWAIWVEMARRERRDYPDAEFDRVAARIVDIEARSLFEQNNAVHQSEFYLSIGWMTPSDRVAAIQDALYEPGDDSDDEHAAALKLDFEHFERVCTEVADVLSGIFVSIEALRGGDLWTYLKSTVSTQRQHVEMPECPAYIDAYLPDEPFTDGKVPMLGNKCLAMFTFRGFPKKTDFALLDEFCHTGVEFRWMTRFLPLDRGAAQQAISRYQRRYFLGRKSIAKYGTEIVSGEESELQNPIARNKSDEAKAALSFLGSGAATFGYFTSTVVVWDEDPRVAERKALRLKKIAQLRQLVVVDETVNGQRAWLGTIPGHVHANIRRPLLHTGNLVRLMPIMAPYQGQPDNAHLRAITGIGIPHVCCVAGTTRFDLNLNVRDVGHTVIIGPTTGGKTTLAGYFAITWDKYGGKVIIYDYGGGMRAATLAMGGAYYAPGDLERGCAFQPLRRVDALKERAWAAQWVQGLLAMRRIVVDHEVEDVVSEVLDAMAADPEPRRRTMTQLVRRIGSHRKDLADALRIYTLEGEYGHIFDSDHDPVADADWRCYELKTLLDRTPKHVVVPVLQYLSHRDEAMLDGSPVLKIKDECWRHWDDPEMVAATRTDVKTGRVNNLFNVYLTQELKDVAGNDVLRSALLTNCPTTIFLPDRKAMSHADLYAAFGLARSEISTIARAPQYTYYYRSELGRSWFALPIGPAALAFLGGARPEDHRAMDEIVRTRDPQDYALALLERRGVTWAVEAYEMLRGRDAA